MLIRRQTDGQTDRQTDVTGDE